MSRRVPVGEIAHARSGDEGNQSNLSVRFYHPAPYPSLGKQLSLEPMGEELCVLVRNALPHLGRLNFVLDNALEGGVSTWLNLNGYGTKGAG